MSGDPPPNAASPPVDPPDLVVGAFSSHPPWLVDPADLTWTVGIDALQAAQRAVACLLYTSR